MPVSNSESRKKNERLRRNMVYASSVANVYMNVKADIITHDEALDQLVNLARIQFRHDLDELARM